MMVAAETGWKSTKDLQARIGRSARFGERSIGVLDAGALLLLPETQNAGDVAAEAAGLK